MRPRAGVLQLQAHHLSCFDMPMHACLFLIKRQNKAGLKDWLQTRDDLGRHQAAVCYAREGDGHACGKEIAWQDLKVSVCCCVAACACLVTCQQALLEADAFDERIQREVDVFISLNQVCPLIPSHNTIPIHPRLSQTHHPLTPPAAAVAAVPQRLQRVQDGVCSQRHRIRHLTATKFTW